MKGRASLRLLAWTTPPEDREAVLGDLAEEYGVRAANDPAAADRWLRRQCLASLLPNLRRRTAVLAFSPAALRGVAMRSLLSDVRFSLRLIRHQRLLASVALGSLVIGLGLNVLLFTVANAVLYRPLPVADPESLIMLGRQRTTGVAETFPYRTYESIAARTDALDTLVAYAARQAAVRLGGETVSVPGELVSGTFFRGLGVPMAVGRGLEPADDRAGAPPAVVVSPALWRRLHGGAALAGQTLTVNGTPFTIVGISAPVFRGMFPGTTADFWLPLAHASGVTGRDLLPEARASWLFLVGRGASGVTPASVRDALDPVLTASLTAAGIDPEPLVVSSGARGSDSLTTRLAAPLRLLMFAAGFVLLVACVNVANLQLARNAARRRELAVRAALGAGRGRLVRLLMVDAILVSVPACVLALGIAWFGRGPALSLITRFGRPVELSAPLDLRVLLFACVATVASALFVGLLASWQGARPPAAALADGGRGETGSRQRLQRSLVIVQFALSMTLLVGAAMLVRSVANLRSTSLGFATGVVLVEVTHGDAQLEGAEALQYIEDAVARAAAVPGVEAASAAHVVPLDFGGSRMTVNIPGYTPADDEDMELNFLRVLPGYFDTMRIPIVRGRPLDARDRAGAPIRIVVNETMARRYWPNGDAVGRPIAVFEETPDAEVAGVVPDVHYRMVREEPRPSFYIAFAQMPSPRAVIHARTRAEPAALVETLRRTVSQVHPRVPVERATSMDEQLKRNIAEDRMAEAVALTLGLSALVLAAAGLYGTMAFAVRRRTREIGVRLALGAAVTDVRRLIFQQGLVLVLPGAAAGALASLAVGRLLANQLYGVSSVDLPSVVGSLLVLVAAAVLATWLPARRATSIDPVVALRD